MTEIAGDVFDGFVTRAEAAQIMGCIRANIHYHIKKGNLVEYDVGGVNMLKLDDVHGLKQKRQMAAVKAHQKKAAREG